METAALDSDLLQVFRLFRIPDTGACHSALEANSTRALDALTAESDGAGEIMEQLVTVHRAGAGLCFANRLPIFEILASSREWHRRLQHLPVEGKLGRRLEHLRDPQAWDVFHFQKRDLPDIFAQALSICEAAEGAADVNAVTDKLSDLGVPVTRNWLLARSHTHVPPSPPYRRTKTGSYPFPR